MIMFNTFILKVEDKKENAPVNYVSALLKREKRDSTKSSASSRLFYNIVLFINFKESMEAIGAFKKSP